MPTFLSAAEPISLIVTTHGTDSFYTEACLGAVQRWKKKHHELIVVVHDESALLRAYLEARLRSGLIDKLLYASHEHGHTRSFNLGVTQSTADVVFNLSNDVLLGPSVLEDCADQLRANPRLGLVGLQRHGTGTRWTGNTELVGYSLRNLAAPLLAEEFADTIRSAPWYSGRTFRALGGPKWIWTVNTSFFGARKAHLESLGGGFGPQFLHYFADDLLCYATLDAGLDVMPFDLRFKKREYFYEFQYENLDEPNYGRLRDRLAYAPTCLTSDLLANSPFSAMEGTLIHLIAQSLPDRSKVVIISPMNSALAILILDALEDRAVELRALEINSGNDAGNGLSRVDPHSTLTARVRPYVGNRHTVAFVPSNGDLSTLMSAVNLVVVDQNWIMDQPRQSAEFLDRCITSKSIVLLVGTDRLQDAALSERFHETSRFERILVCRSVNLKRLCFEWDSCPIADQQHSLLPQSALDQLW